MTNQHPITPPPELVQQWREESSTGELHFSPQYLAVQAARWGADQQLKLDAEQIAQAYQKGADQELEKCCAEVLWQEGSALAAKLRDRRRPKPPSLKEQALEALEVIPKLVGFESEREAIRRALEALPNG